MAGEDIGYVRYLQRKTEFHFIEYWKEGERPLDWFANWRHLNLCMYEIEIVDLFRLCELEVQIGNDLSTADQPGAAKNLSDDDREKFIDFYNENPSLDAGMTEEELEKWRRREKVFNKRFRVAEDPHARFICGKCSLEDDRAIDLIQEGEAPPVRGKLGKGRITIHEAEDNYLGAIGVTDETDIQRDRTGESQVGDLWFEFYVPKEIFYGLVERIQQVGSGAVCYAHISALVFQGEVEGHLAEPHHFQTYFLEKGQYSTMGRAVLESVQVRTPKQVGPEPTSGYRDHAGFDDFDDTDGGNWSDEQPASAAQSQPPAQIVTQPQKPIRLWPVTFALWAIFCGLFLNAIAR